MNRANVLGADVKTIEQQLDEKKAAYTAAMKRGEVFNDLKKIFLEIKILQGRLQEYHFGTSSMDTL